MTTKLLEDARPIFSIETYHDFFTAGSGHRMRSTEDGIINSGVILIEAYLEDDGALWIRVLNDGVIIFRVAAENCEIKYEIKKKS